jgi:hypothetical protein
MFFEPTIDPRSPSPEIRTRFQGCCCWMGFALEILMRNEYCVKYCTLSSCSIRASERSSTHHETQSQSKKKLKNPFILRIQPIPASFSTPLRSKEPHSANCRLQRMPSSIACCHFELLREQSLSHSHLQSCYFFSIQALPW